MVRVLRSARCRARRKRGQALVEFGLVLVIFVPFCILVGALLLSLYQSSAVSQGATWLGDRITQTGTACADGTTNCDWVDEFKTEMAGLGITVGAGDSISVSVTKAKAKPDGTPDINYYDQTNPTLVPTAQYGDTVMVRFVAPITGSVLVGTGFEQIIEGMPGSSTSWLGVSQLDKTPATGGITLVGNFGLDYTANVKVDAPAAYWPLGETGGNTFFENGGDTTKNGTIGSSVGVGVPSLILAGHDGAFHLDGTTNSWLAVPNVNSLNFGPNNAWSLELWVNRDRSGDFGAGCANDEEPLLVRPTMSLVISRADGCASDPGALDRVSLMLGSGLRLSTTQTIMNDGAPHHIVVTYDGTHTSAAYVEVRIYIDGQNAQLRSGAPYDTAASMGTNRFPTSDISGWTGASGPLLFGAQSQSAGTARLSATLDELALYRAPLSADLVALHYVAGVKVGLVAAVSGRTIYFQDLTNGSPISWQWTFATDTGSVEGTSGDQNPGFAFPDTGTKDITLTTHTMAGDTAKTIDGLVQVKAGSTLGASFAFDYGNMVKAQTPISYWRLGEGSGTAMVDEMGHNNGTYGGAVAFGASLLSADSNQALNLGAGAYDISVPDSASLHLSTFSLTLKVSRARAGVAEDLFSANGITLGINAANRLELRFAGGTATSSVNMVTGTTYDIVATYAGGVAHLFVNGVDSTSVSGTLPASYQLAGPLVIGAGGTTTQFRGTIDELVLYPRVLASVDVNALIAAATQIQSTMTVTSGMVVAFADKSSGGPTSYSWDFGDGSGANTANPTHQYTTSGSYTVWLTISDGTNWTSVMVQNLVTVP